MCHDLEQVVAGGVVQAGEAEFVEHQKVQALQTVQPTAQCYRGKPRQVGGYLADEQVQVGTRTRPVPQTVTRLVPRTITDRVPRVDTITETVTVPVTTTEFVTQEQTVTVEDPPDPVVIARVKAAAQGYQAAAERWWQGLCEASDAAVAGSEVTASGWRDLCAARGVAVRQDWAAVDARGRQQVFAAVQAVFAQAAGRVRGEPARRWAYYQEHRGWWLAGHEAEFLAPLRERALALGQQWWQTLTDGGMAVADRAAKLRELKAEESTLRALAGTLDLGELPKADEAALRARAVQYAGDLAQRLAAARTDTVASRIQQELGLLAGYGIVPAVKPAGGGPAKAASAMLFQGIDLLKYFTPAQAKALRYTLSKEGGGFTTCHGDVWYRGRQGWTWDHSILNYGIISFNLPNGGCAALLRRLVSNGAACRELERLFPQFIADPELLPDCERAFGADDATMAAWWRENALADEHHLRPEWHDLLVAWAETEPNKRVQLEQVCAEYIAPAVAAAEKLGVTSERGLALLFDMAVQRGTQWVADLAGAVKWDSPQWQALSEQEKLRQLLGQDTEPDSIARKEPIVNGDSAFEQQWDLSFGRSWT